MPIQSEVVYESLGERYVYAAAPVINLITDAGLRATKEFFSKTTSPVDSSTTMTAGLARLLFLTSWVKAALIAAGSAA